MNVLSSIIDNKIAKKRKQSKCPLIDKEVNKCDIHRMDYYLATERNKVPICYNMVES